MSSQSHLVEVTTARAVVPYRAAWDKLAEAPLERNVFAEAWMLLPAVEHLAEGEDPRAGLVFDSGGSNELLGVFPFARASRWNHLPIAVASGWIHGQSYLGTLQFERSDSAIDRFRRAISIDAQS